MYNNIHACSGGAAGGSLSGRTTGTPCAGSCSGATAGGGLAWPGDDGSQRPASGRRPDAARTSRGRRADSQDHRTTSVGSLPGRRSTDDETHLMTFVASCHQKDLVVVRHGNGNSWRDTLSRHHVVPFVKLQDDQQMTRHI